MSGSGGDKYQQQQQRELQQERDIYFIDTADFIIIIKSTIMMDKDIAEKSIGERNLFFVKYLKSMCFF